jgi:uncharacterized protein YggE
MHLKSLAMAGSVLALSVQAAPALAGKPDPAASEVALHIEANGIVAPDRVELPVPIEARGATREEAIAKLREKQDAFVSKLGEAGIGRDRITIQSPEEMANLVLTVDVVEYDEAPAPLAGAKARANAKPKPPQVRVSSTVTVRLDDLSKLDTVQNAATSDGLNSYMFYNRARFTASDPAAAAQKAREQAVAKARAEADAYAATLGYRVIRMTRVSNGAPPFSLLDMWRMMNIVDFNATRFQPSYYAGITPATVAIDFVIAPK